MIELLVPRVQIGQQGDEPFHTTRDSGSAMKNRSNSAGSGGLVYSTEAGRMCPACRQPVAACICGRPPPAAADAGGIVRVSRETQGRGGKGVTLVRGLALDAEALGALAKRLKAACGSGGTVKDGVIEIQGEQRDRIVALLQREGHTVKRAGG